MSRLRLAVLLFCLPVSGLAGGIEPIQYISVHVDFSSQDWLLEIDPLGRVRGYVGKAAFAPPSLAETALKRIRGLALCVATLPQPTLQAPPMMDSPEAFPPVALLTLRARTSRGSIVERRIRASVDTLDKHEVSIDLGPALQLLAELRGLVPIANAYDYRPWLNELLPRQNHPQCPWLATW